jgi:hypothetical protein
MTLDIKELSMREQQGMHWLIDLRSNLRDEGHSVVSRWVGAAIWIMWEVLKWMRRKNVEPKP